MSWLISRTAWWRRRPERPPVGALALGADRTAGVGVGPKGALLDRAAAAGLPVPAGFIVPDGVQTSTDVGAWADRVGAHTLAVRSAFAAEDGWDRSLAGFFATELDIRPGDVGAAVARVRRSADRRDGEFRLDVLVMAMIRARHAGVAFSEPGTYDDLVNVTTGLADRLVSGEIPGEGVELPRIERAPEGWRRRLQELLRAVRSEFGDEPWDIEWADDGRRCWLIQIRPITAPALRDEALTMANHAEILPPLPSCLMTSVIEEAGPDLFDWYRARVPGLPANRDFLHVVAGRPMINLSLLEDMMRELGLPTALVAESIGGRRGHDRPVDLRRVVASAPSLVRLGAAQVRAVAGGRRARAHIAAIGAEPAETFGEALDDLHTAYVALVTGMFPLSSAIGPPVALLRKLGTLYEHAGRHHTITTELAERVVRLRSLPWGPRREAELDRFLREFGHRGIYESDIARPRYREDPDALAPADSPVATDTAAAPTSRPAPLRRVATWPLWLAASRPLAARELLRHEAMRGFAAIRRSIVSLAERAADRGQLRTPDDIWSLTANEARRLDHGWIPDAAFWDLRTQERARLASIDVPHVVSRRDDPAEWSQDREIDRHRSLRGLPLTAGTVTGAAWVLDEPSAEVPDGFDPARTILVARSLDAGWVTTLSRVAGVVVEIGGDLSHGSILVREIGTPAVTNVAGATRRIATGDRITVRAGAGSVEVHDREPAAHAVG